jgi:ATP-dependent Lon protease
MSTEIAFPAPAGEIPRQLPVLPLKETVVFPGAMAPLAIGEERSIRLIDDVVDSATRMVALVTARDPSVAEPSPELLYDVGTVAVVQRMMKVPDGTLRILAQGVERIRVGPYTSTSPYLIAQVEAMPERGERSKEVVALGRNIQAIFSRIIDLVPYLPDELELAVANIEDPVLLGHIIAASMRFSTEEKQELLSEMNLETRLRRVMVLLNREAEVLELGAKIQSEVQSDMEKEQREYYLRQQLRAIQQELGETDETQAEINELRLRLAEADPPAEIRMAAERELDRLSRLPSAAAEYGVIRTYIDWILSIPWNVHTEDNLDLRRARRILDEDHYDIEKVKDRIIEHLAVARLKQDVAGPILCFVGPPGVGKTSLGQSIARALGRKFARMSVGGVRDEAEIRGHRRTYIGAMPGTIVRAIRDSGSMNPVLMIDEIDKMGSDVRGDPSSAMLEVLDPAQHHTFRDHYLDLPLDLSRVLFLCTANMLETIPGPLLDRMEIIRLAGYTDEEKLHIARRYLVPRQLEQNGVSGTQVRIGDPALKTVISEYTREAGVRSLERQVGAVVRKIARQIAEGSAKRVSVSRDMVRKLLGPERVMYEVKRRTKEPGVATGLAVTGVGGEILFVEAQVMPGSGRLVVTGQLGDVMRESAQAAVSYVRAHREELSLDLPEDFFASHDIHLHVPAGAVPKDGPSAGVTLTTALVSALSGRPVDGNVAMTGEITLTGNVLPIGGVKEKVLAAHRAGIKTVIIPKANEPQLRADVPAELQREVRVVTAERLGEVLSVALNGRRRRSTRAPARR